MCSTTSKNSSISSELPHLGRSSNSRGLPPSRSILGKETIPQPKLPNRALRVFSISGVELGKSESPPCLVRRHLQGQLWAKHKHKHKHHQKDERQEIKKAAWVHSSELISMNGEDIRQDYCVLKESVNHRFTPFIGVCLQQGF